MSATEPRPLRADARRNRERIIDAAREVFAQEGDGAQMDDVARRAGVGIGTVYRHFPTKDVLLGEIMRAKFRHHVEVARRWDATGGGWSALEGFLREIVAQMRSDATQHRLMWIDDAAALAHAEPDRLELVAVVGAIIERAKVAGEVRPDLDVDDMPALMCAIGSVMGARGAPIPRAEMLTDVIIDGLRAR